MVAVTLLRGFKIPISTLDAFLAANGVDETYGAPPLFSARSDGPVGGHPDGGDNNNNNTKDAISVLLHAKLGPDADPHGMARVVIPQRRGMNRAPVAYVAYVWVMSFAHCEIRLDADLSVPEHPAFEMLRQEMLGFGGGGGGGDDDSAKSATGEGKVGLYLVVTDEGRYTPKVLKQRKQIPQHCDQCDETFHTPDAWQKRQDHRRQVHGSSEGDYPLPEA